MRKAPLLAATRNPGKLVEIEHALRGLPFRLLPLPPCVPPVAETGRTFRENAILKALGYARATGLPALAEDAGLEAAALRGAPGVLSARFAGPGATDADNNRLLLERLRGLPDEGRYARYVCVAVLAIPSRLLGLARGEVAGRILATPRGAGGFGYDPLFLHPPLGLTFAEISVAEKEAHSHRGQALRLLRRALLAFARDPRSRRARG